MTKFITTINVFRHQWDKVDHNIVKCGLKDKYLHIKKYFNIIHDKLYKDEKVIDDVTEYLNTNIFLLYHEMDNSTVICPTDVIKWIESYENIIQNMLVKYQLTMRVSRTFKPWISSEASHMINYKYDLINRKYHSRGIKSKKYFNHQIKELNKKLYKKLRNDRIQYNIQNLNASDPNEIYKLKKFNDTINTLYYIVHKGKPYTSFQDIANILDTKFSTYSSQTKEYVLKDLIKQDKYEASLSNISMHRSILFTNQSFHITRPEIITQLQTISNRVSKGYMELPIQFYKVYKKCLLPFWYFIIYVLINMDFIPKSLNIKNIIGNIVKVRS